MSQLSPALPDLMIEPVVRAALLEDLGFLAIGLDFNGEALREARRLHGVARDTLRWLQADLFDRQP